LFSSSSVKSWDGLGQDVGLMFFLGLGFGQLEGPAPLVNHGSKKKKDEDQKNSQSLISFW